jgi:hypothetical protein
MSIVSGPLSVATGTEVVASSELESAVSFGAIEDSAPDKTRDPHKKKKKKDKKHKKERKSSRRSSEENLANGDGEERHRNLSEDQSSVDDDYDEQGNERKERRSRKSCHSHWSDRRKSADENSEEVRSRTYSSDGLSVEEGVEGDSYEPLPAADSSSFDFFAPKSSSTENLSVDAMPSISEQTSSMSNRSRSPERPKAPSGVCGTRRHSPVLKTSSEVDHELFKGREAILVASLSSDEKVGGFRPIQSSNEIPSLPRLHRKDPVQRSKSDVVGQHEHPSQYLRDPAPLRLDAWMEPPGMSFQVRGSRYDVDSVKVDSLPSVFRLLTVDLVKCEEPLMTGMCAHPRERIQKALMREREMGIRELPEFIFAINLIIPGTYHTVFYFGIDDIDIIRDASTPFGKLAYQFFFGNSDEFRDQTFKLIPRIVDGNFLVRKAVGSKPAILGKKIKQTYIRTNRYMELLCDIANEKMACGIVKLSLGYAKTLSVDMAFVLEGNDVTTLPEQILGAVRMKNIEFKKRDGQRNLS